MTTDDPFASRGGWSVAATTDTPTADALPPCRYVLGERLGRGAMGEVYVAVDPVLGRTVALKVLARDAPAAAGARLRREAHLMAGLDHPGIVAVHDAAVLPDGRPCVAMRRLPGTTLTSAMQAARTPDERRALLRELLSVAEALAFAHAAGVVHRDVKPDNILLGDHGEALLSDWGVARRLHDVDEAAGETSSEPHLTTFGARIGTPAWMAPEVSAGATGDTRADVHALGRVLGAVLGADPSVLPLQLPAWVPRDLASLVRCATAPDPARRYGDASGLARDLRAWLDGAPVGAHRYAAHERAARFVARHRAIAGVSLVAAAIVTATALVASARTRSALDETTTARNAAELRLVDQLAARATEALRQDDVVTAESLAAQALALREDVRARGVLAATRARPRPTLTRAIALDGVGVSISPTLQQLITAAPGVARLIDADGRTRMTRELELQRVLWLDDQYVALGDATGEADLFDRVSGAHTPAPPAPWPRGAAWHAVENGELVSKHRCDTRVIHTQIRVDSAWVQLCAGASLLWQLPGGPVQQRPLAGVSVDPARIVSVGWADASSARVALGADEGWVGEYDLETGASRDLAHGARTMLELHGSPSGRWLGARDDSGMVHVIDPQLGAVVMRFPGAGVETFGLDDHTLSVAGRTWSWWSLPQDRGSGWWRGGRGVSTLAFSRDGTQLAAAGADGVVHLLTVPDLAEIGAHRVGSGIVRAVGFAADGSVWAHGSDAEAVTWIAPDGTLRPGVALRTPVLRRLAVLDDGTAVAALWGSWISLHHPNGGTTHIPLTGAAHTLLPRPDGASVLVLVDDGSLLEVWSDGWAHAGHVDGADTLAVDAREHLWSALQLQVTRSPPLPGGPLVFEETVQVVAAGEMLVVGTAKGTVVLADLDGRELARVPAHDGRVGAVAVSPDGRMAASGGWDGRVRLWDLETLTLPREVPVADAAARLGPWAVARSDADPTPD